MRKRFGRWLVPLLVALLLGIGLMSPGMFWRPAPTSWFWRPAPQVFLYRPGPTAFYWRPRHRV